MRSHRVASGFFAVVALVAVAGCSGTALTPADPLVTGSVQPVAPPEDALTGASPSDLVSLGKKQFREGSYGLAEQSFRRAVEAGPRDLEAWLGLAAAYDRLHRFDLADRAYAQAIRQAGETVEILNNQGFSRLLRGDVKSARAKFHAALKRDPGNPNVLANLDLLDASLKLRKDIR